jgi:hypothetical protein
MIYKIKNTEINNKKASEFETKSLLYLIGFRKDSSEINLLAIDCLNDVTGLSKSFEKLWDIQSKNHSTLNPKKIGVSLFTLFDNFISEINFHELILFVPKLTENYLIDSNLMSHDINNFKPPVIEKIKNGLAFEILRVKNTCDNSKLDLFFKKVTFVQDNKKNSTYIKGITKFKNKKTINEDLYNSIFEDIRDVQSIKKNSYIEGIVINDIRDIIPLNRHIYTKDIKTLIINRIIGFDLFATQYTISFLPEIRKTVDDDDAKDLLQECKSNLTRAFFNKSSNKEFWLIIEELINIISSTPQTSIYETLDYLRTKIQIRSSYFNEKSILFLISLIKDGFKDEN